MPSRNDLSSLKTGTSKLILPGGDDQTTGSQMSKGRVGRPPKGKDKKRSYKITLSLTPAEGTKISKKAGLAGEATFLYAFLKDSGIFD